MLQNSLINQPLSSLILFKNQYKETEPENIFTLSSTYLHNTKVSTAKSTLDNNHITSSFMTKLSDPTPNIIIKITFRQKRP